ncbi:hypothetical protein LOTGIDRAFT_131242 [Lottia gigantea]|uniref:TIP41-like protein n=1 Tax=Lottia gigantea TaxID=225164 RepID=V3ZVF7_LOTGI|nr:hypothetical protein LOTGIDRAFT_131242 [Lottia gigantea]ESO84906.1 hypothetical protein LOTGIDRAFT_131242 [Lottia gigantea]
MAQNIIPLKAPITKKFQFGPWKLTSTKSHILTSEGSERERFENVLELPQVPEMVFAENILRLEHSGGFGVEFNALDALKQVEAHDDPLKVAAAKVWQEARSECEHIKNVVKPFDWTFSTDYKGTTFGNIKVERTEERIDLEKLKKREEILFYDDFLLFEDELSDNGSSMLNCKIRVMPSSFFILLRFYMRVDDVIVRVNDTRLYYERDSNYILREYSSRDDQIKDLKIPIQILTDMNQVGPRLTIRQEKYDKLVFPGEDNKPTS